MPDLLGSGAPEAESAAASLASAAPPPAQGAPEGGSAESAESASLASAASGAPDAGSASSAQPEQHRAGAGAGASDGAETAAMWQRLHSYLAAKDRAPKKKEAAAAPTLERVLAAIVSSLAAADADGWFSEPVDSSEVTDYLDLVKYGKIPQLRPSRPRLTLRCCVSAGSRWTSARWPRRCRRASTRA